MRWGARIARPIDSLYLGGGTPTLLGGENIAKIINSADRAFGMDDAEITLECNPADHLKETLSLSAEAGVNRLSLGVQSGIERELRLLGRRHGTGEVAATLKNARDAGISNISLDLMIGLPESNLSTLRRSLDFVLSNEPKHVSVYILKIEEGTPFGRTPPALPDDDAVAEQYLFAAEYLEKNGLLQYEISNFAIPSYESRHNTRYWDCREYLGIGPAAHSFLDGRRFYYPREYRRFMEGCATVPDGNGGDSDEYILLRLRLCEGIVFEKYEKRFGAFPKAMLKKAERLIAEGYVELDGNGIRLTKKGFLISNAVIGELI